MIIATAGHVDHGKTLLVKALTGVDTDRLPEEKLRGLTIDLGFAYHHLNSDTVLGFVDVPGHERFIRNMLAGVSAIDFALLVVAADDGLMPQTREHLDILNLLGIDSGAVALSKTDLVDSARIQAVENEIADLLAATPLKNSPIFPVSVVNGNLGIQALSSHLEKTALKHRPRESHGEFRFSIDRCFTLRGAGLVVTGTVVSGTIQNGEQLILSPQGQPVRIRSIHAHDRKSTVAKVGQRCALNLTGKKLDKDIVGRGDWIIAPALHEPVSRLHARLRLLPGETNKLKSGTAVHVHLGASDVTGRVGILDQRTISPGQDAYVRLHLDHPVCALARDRLVLRDKSAKRTIGGGVVVDPFPQTRSANQKAMLKAMDVGSPAEVLVGMLPLSPGGINLDRFQRSWNLTVEELHALLEAQPVFVFENNSIRFALWNRHWQAACKDIVSTLDNLHRAHPAESGTQENVLLGTLELNLSSDVFSAGLRHLIEVGTIERRQAFLCLSTHLANMSEEDENFWKQVGALLGKDQLRPPVLQELSLGLGMDAKLARKKLLRLVRWKLVVQVSDNRFFLTDQISRLVEHARQASKDSSDGRFTAGEYRDRTGIGRNVAIEVLEYFDRIKLTGIDSNARRGLYELVSN